MNGNAYNQEGDAHRTNIPILPKMPQMQLFAENDQDSTNEFISFGTTTSEGGKAGRARSASEELYEFATSTCSSNKKAKFETSAATTTTSSSHGIKSPCLLPAPLPFPSPFGPQGISSTEGTAEGDNNNGCANVDSDETSSYPSDNIRLVKVADGQWMCDICKEARFTSFGEACIHEVVCKMIARDTSGCTLQALLTASSSSSATSEEETSSEQNEQPKDNLASDKPNEQPQDSLTNTSDKPNEQADPVQKPSPPQPSENDEAPKKTTRDADKPAKEPTKKKVQSKDDVSDKSAVRPTRTEAKLNVSLIPKEENRDVLSDYNYILTQNIEFFESVTKMGSAMSYSRIGLRCIHCSGYGYHITAASFFPSSTASIASGLGTIGARHFLGEKCPSLSPDTLRQLRLTKKSSQVQTRSVGRVGLDAYCKDLASKNDIATHQAGGIYFTGTVEEAENATERKATAEKKAGESTTESKAEAEEAPTSKGPDASTTHTTEKDEPRKEEDPKQKEPTENAPPQASADDNAVVVPKKEYTGKPEKIEASSFVPGRIEHFWECKHCSALPVPWRAAGSVVFSSGAPSLDVVKGHLEKCQGLATLCVPRTAEIDIGYGESVPPIRISWDNSQLLKKSDSIERKKASGGGSTRKNSLLPSGEVKTGVEEISLAVPEDQELTTDFAYTTMTLLKKCYLTKSGGSRGNCPIGYPGLACSYCAGQPNERRFFYTSADHLRNSFSHIPSHLLVCRNCPADVKDNLEGLKALRNRQKAQLHAGSHKTFIDNVWSRLHGPNDVRKNDYLEEDSESSDDESEVSIDELCDSAAAVLTEMKSSTQLLTRSSQPATVTKIEFGSSNLVVTEEKHLTTDFVYLSLLQCDVYNLTEADLAQGIGEVGLPVLSCKHCQHEEGRRKVFLARSASHLRNTLSSISNHLAVCHKCPQEIRAQIDSVKRIRAEQEADLKRGMHLKFCEKVWSRLIMQDKSEKPDVPQIVLPNGASQLVLPEDQSLVSDFTHYTMTQMTPCILEATGNGARSTFEPGWPGLACSYCAGQPNNRKFYYRNCEILAGNYAHIPNHLMACRHVPLQVKALLQEKKKTHGSQKSKLSRGSQRSFFERIWRRLHSNRAMLLRAQIASADSEKSAPKTEVGTGTAADPAKSVGEMEIDATGAGAVVEEKANGEMETDSNAAEGSTDEDAKAAAVALPS